MKLPGRRGGGAATLDREVGDRDDPESSSTDAPLRPAPAPMLPTPKRRPRRGLLAAGVLLAVLFALGTYMLVSRSGERVGVVGLAHPVAWGQVITDDDLVQVQLVPDPALHPVPWSDVDSVVGRRAAADLTAGSLLTADSVQTVTAVPPKGKALVGVLVTAGQAPTTPLNPGDRVVVVHTAPAGAADAARATGQADAPGVTGTVFAVSAPGSTGDRTVDVLVDQADANGLAQASAAGETALVLMPRS